MSSYLKKLKSTEPLVEANQTLKYIPFKEGLAEGIANCYYLVWGDGFPAKFMYEPDEIKDYYLNKGQIGGFAVTEKNEVVGMFCAYRFLFNPALYEIGGLMVIPNYRRKVDIEKMIHICEDQLEEKSPDAVFCQTVSHYQTPQKVLNKLIPSQKVCGIELEAFTYLKNGITHVSSYLDTASVVDKKEVSLNVIELYLPILQEIYERLELSVRYKTEIHQVIAEKSEFHTFSYETVMKIQLAKIGQDLQTQIKDLTQPDAYTCLQVSISLEDESAPWAISELNAMGYFFAAIVPFYDGSHCLVLQKLKKEPSFTSIDLYTNQAHHILEFIKNDYIRVSG